MTIVLIVVVLITLILLKRVIIAVAVIKVHLLDSNCQHMREYSELAIYLVWCKLWGVWGKAYSHGTNCYTLCQDWSQAQPLFIIDTSLFDFFFIWWSPGILNLNHDAKWRGGIDNCEVGIFYKKCQVAAKAIGAIPSLIIYPIVPFLVVAVFLIYWLAALLYLASAGSVTQNNCNNSCAAYDLTLQAISDNSCCGYSLHHSKNIAWAIVYHIFGVFWTTQFIIACCLTTIAGAIAAYYWARGETTVRFLYHI